MAVYKMDESSIIKIYNDGINSVVSLVKDLNVQISSLSKQVDILNNRITELETRLNKNSSNSSKPPSSDGLKKPRSSREKSGKPTGGQPGHEGKTLQKVDNPDEVIEVKPHECECGHDLSGIEGTIRSRQVFELPIIKIKVTEYRTHEVECPCCKKMHKAKFPETVTQPVQYGENMQAFMIYLTNYQLLPLERATEIVSDIIGHKVSEGTLVNVNSRLHENLEDVESSIKEQLKASTVVHFDETGMRCSGKTQWLHSASTERLTHYEIHERRGARAANDIGILKEFEGTAVHDHWKPYYTFNNCSHAECNAHNLRNLKGAYEDYKYEWAKDMAGLLIEIKRHVYMLKSQGHTEISAHEIAKYQATYKSILLNGREEAPIPISEKTGKPKKNLAHNLLERLEKFDIETLSFMYDFSIPFDNNLAERDIRMVKLRQKISGSFRGEQGPDVFCRIRSYISTCRKNGQKVMESLVRAIKGEPFVPQTL
jgi:transposase